MNRPPKPAFVERFDRVWSRMRRASVGAGVCQALLAALAGLAALAAADYWLEIDLQRRTIALAVVGGTVGLLAIVWIVSAVRSWSRPQTAEEIEARFPQLGQAVRTSVQFGGRPEQEIGAEGVAAPLVTALADDTRQRTDPLDIGSIVPAWRFRLAVAAVICAAAAFATAVVMVPDWRVATLRALLDNRPYTELTVSPGDSLVDEGNSLAVAIDLRGRTSRQVLLCTRPAGDSEAGWTRRELTAQEAVSRGPRDVQYAATLANIGSPLEYQVLAGPIHSEVYRVKVRYPLAIERIQVTVTPPEYTGLEPETAEEGNVNAIHGSTARFAIQLDRPAAEAQMIFQELGRGPRDKPRTEAVPLDINGAMLTATLPLTANKSYTIVAADADGIALPENKYRIRVRRDQPPQVWFEEPDVALEVHGLAEVLLRARVRDDFGLSRAGIVFEVNNEEEYPLLLSDFREIAKQLREDGGRVTPRTRAALERVLPLEVFGLTQKDSVTYYAFAEDNYPDGARRTETDLRFIDIRPFRRLYRLPDPEAMDGGGDARPRVRSLQELIARQRFNLNRTIRLNRQADSRGEVSLVTVERVAQFEDDLAKSTRELAEFLDEREFDGSDLLFQAEEAMINAVDSLGVSKYNISTRQQKDALRLLIEGRNRIEIFLRQATGVQLAALRNFDRMQTQKLRRPKNENEDDPQRLAERIRRLAEQEEIVYRTLAGTTLGGSAPQKDAQPVKTDGGQGGPENPSAKQGEGGEKKKDRGENAEKKSEEKGEEKSEKKSEEKSEEKKKPAGEGKSTPDASDEKTGPLSRAEIEKLQDDLAVEAREVERLLNRIRDMSQLARQRGTRAAETVERASGALARGNSEEAAKTAREASQLLRELALNVEGLLAQEAAQKIAMSRDIAAGLARAQRRLAERADPDEKSKRAAAGKSKVDEAQRRQRLAAVADRLAESGKTLEDILGSVVETNSPREREAARLVDELLGEGKVDEAVERMPGVAILLRDDRPGDAKVEALDLGDSLDATARRLDEIYRTLVMPRMDELLKLERQAAKLRKEMQQLQTNQDITRWHQDATELVEKLEQAGAAEEPREELQDAMEEESKRRRGGAWLWDKGRGGSYLAPKGYARATSKIIQELQAQMQELVLTDIVASDDTATPPRYRQLVERYIQVLSSDLQKQE